MCSSIQGLPRLNSERSNLRNLHVSFFEKIREVEQNTLFVEEKTTRFEWSSLANRVDRVDRPAGLAIHDVGCGWPPTVFVLPLQTVVIKKHFKYTTVLVCCSSILI